MAANYRYDATLISTYLNRADEVVTDMAVRREDADLTVFQLISLLAVRAACKAFSKAFRKEIAE